MRCSLIKYFFSLTSFISNCVNVESPQKGRAHYIGICTYFLTAPLFILKLARSSSSSSQTVSSVSIFKFSSKFLFLGPCPGGGLSKLGSDHLI